MFVIKLVLTADREGYRNSAIWNVIWNVELFFCLFFWEIINGYDYTKPATMATSTSDSMNNVGLQFTKQTRNYTWGQRQIKKKHHKSVYLSSVASVKVMKRWSYLAVRSLETVIVMIILQDEAWQNSSRYFPLLVWTVFPTHLQIAELIIFIAWAFTSMFGLFLVQCWAIVSTPVTKELWAFRGKLSAENVTKASDI